jgi:hypothetical protein
VGGVTVVETEKKVVAEPEGAAMSDDRLAPTTMTLYVELGLRVVGGRHRLGVSKYRGGQGDGRSRRGKKTRGASRHEKETFGDQCIFYFFYLSPINLFLK